MDPRTFTSTAFGSVQKTPGGKASFYYFRPAPIPRQLDLTPETISLLSEADAALGQLQGLCEVVKEPDLFVVPYIRQEALATSRIEGTQASLTDLLVAQTDRTRKASDDVREVERYLAASRHAFSAIANLPITQRLIKEAHAILLQGVRGSDKLPGELRKSPVWVGSSGATPETAQFVPPLPDEVPAALTDWEEYVNSPNEQPALIRCALMHYQFETIHPFLDGNGRIGRLLINLMLLEEGRLSKPTLHISSFFESHRSEYYRRLQNVRETGAIQEWFQFFLVGVRDQARDVSQRAMALIALRDRYLAEALQTRSKLPMLVDILFVNPLVTAGYVAERLGITDQGARNLIGQAAHRGWLIEQHPAGSRRAYWLAQAVFNTLEPEGGGVQ